MVDDAEKRLSVFFDQLNNNTVSAGIVAPLLDLSDKLEKQDWVSASNIQVNLMSTHYGELGPVLLGLKRLLDIVKAM